MILGMIDVDDQGTLKIKNYKNALDDLEGSNKKVGDSTREMNKGLGEASNSFDELTARSGDLIESLVTLTGAGVLGELLKESAELAARNQTLGVVMGVVAANSKTSSFEFSVQAELVKRLGITTQEASDSVIKFAQANLNVADTSKIARVAQDLAVVAGMNSSQAFGILTQSIQANQTLMLRQFGIVTGLTQIYGEYAKTIGKTATTLDESEKKQAFVNKILEEGEKVAGAYEQAMTTAGKQMTSFARFAEDAKNALGEALIPVMYAVVVGANTLLDSFTHLEQGHRALITAILSGIAIFALLTGAIKAVTALGLVDWFINAGKSATTFFSTVAAGELTVEALAGPLTLIVGLVSVLAGWYIYHTAQTEVNTDAVVKNAAAYQANLQTLEGLQKKTDALKLSTDDYTKVVAALVKIAPEQAAAIEKSGASYDTVTAAIKNATAAQKELLQAQYLTLGGQVAQIEDQVAAAQAKYNKTAEQISSAMERLKQAAGPEILAVKAQIASYDEELQKNQQTLTGLTGKLTSAKSGYDAMREALDANFHSTQQNARANELLVEELSKVGGSSQKLQELMHLAKLTVDDLNKAASDPVAMKAFIQKLEDASAAHDKLTDKNKKLRDQLEQTYEEISGKDTVAFDVLNEHINKVAFGSDQYFALLSGPGKSALTLFEAGLERGAEGAVHLGDGIKKNLLAAIEAIQQKKFAEELDKWTVAGQKAEETLTDSLTTSLEKFHAANMKANEDAAISFQAQAVTISAALMKVDDDLRIRTVTSKKTQVDQQIAQNDRYFQNLIDANNKQIASIQATYDREMLKYAELAKSRKAEIDDIIDKAELRMRQDDAVRTHELETQAILHPVLAAEYAFEIQQIYELQAKRVEAMEGERSLAIEGSNATIAADRQEYINRSQLMEGFLNQLQDQNARIRQANASTNQDIIRQSGAMWSTLTQFPAQFVSTLLKGFESIIDGQKKFADLFVDIWKSIESEIFAIFDRIVKKWIDSQIANMLSGGSGQTVSYGYNAAGGNSVTTSGGMGGAARFGGGSLLALGGIDQVLTSQSTGQSLMGGAMAGAGIGTMIAPGIGTAIGAGVGLLAGGVAHLLGVGGASQQELDQRKTVDDFQGQLAGLMTAQQKLESSGKTWQNTLITVRDAYAKLGMTDAQAQADTARLWDSSKKSAEEVAAAIKNISDKVDLVKQREELLKTSGGIETLRKNAQLAGVDIEKMLSTTNINEFNVGLEQLNKALDEQAKRLEGLGKMASGLAQREGGFESLIDRTVGAAGDASGMNSDQLNGVLTAYGKNGKGQTLQGFAGANGFSDLADQLSQKIPKLQKEFDSLGKDAVFQFSSIVRETGDLGQAMSAISPTLDRLISLQGEFGFTSNTALAHLLEFRNTIKVNDDVAATVSGINQELRAMTESGIKSQDMFTSFGDEAASQWDILKDRGVAADQAMMLMQPTLQALYEGQKRFGYETDSATQGLIDMGLQQGIIGDQMQSVNDKILDVLVKIGESVGADIPDAYKDMKDKASDAAKIQQGEAKKAEKSYNDVGTSVDGITTQLEASAAYAAGAWQRDMIDAAHNVEHAINGVALGHSPGGVKEITYQLGLASKAMKTFHADATSSMLASERGVNSYASAIDGLPQNVGKTPQGSNLAAQVAEALSVVLENDNGKPVQLIMDGRVVGTTVVKRTPEIVRRRGVGL